MPRGIDLTKQNLLREREIFLFEDVRFILKDKGMRYDVYSKAEKVNAHILLPKGKTCQALYVNGAETPFEIVKVADSTYVDFSVKGEKKLAFELLFAE